MSIDSAAKTVLFTGSSLPSEYKVKLEDLGYCLKIERADLSEDDLIVALHDVDAYILGGAERATRRLVPSVVV